MSDDSKADATPETPFVGLAPYAEGDAAFFFGRDRETRIVAGNLRAARLTLVYGASGVGKTSLLRAGVMRDLARGAPRGADCSGRTRTVRSLRVHRLARRSAASPHGDDQSLGHRGH